MCAVSAVIQDWTNPLGPNYVPFTPASPQPVTAEQMLKVIELLEKIDQKLGAQNCKLEEKEKNKFKRKLRRRAGAKK